jgi:hypothetical protein
MTKEAKATRCGLPRQSRDDDECMEEEDGEDEEDDGEV